MRIATASVRTGFAMTVFCKKCGTAGRCGERTERCRWQRKRSERVAAVKILSDSRKAAQKFWAPQQDHRPLRRGYWWCVGEGLCPSRGRGRTPPLRKRNKRCNGRATARVAPTDGLQEVQWAGDREGRPYGGGVMGPRSFFVFMQIYTGKTAWDLLYSSL